MKIIVARQRQIWTAAYLVLVLTLAGASLARPLYGWDLIGYIGNVLALEGRSPDQVQALAYADARAVVPPDEYAALVGERPTDATAYRRDVARNVDHFAQQLRFYRVRPLYIGLQYALHELGVSPQRAIFLVSAVAYVVIALVVFAWSRRYLPLPYAAGASLLLLVTPPLLLIGRTASPDALSTAALLSAVYALTELRRRALFVVLMLGGILVRSDNAIFAVLLFVYLGLFATEERWPRKTALGLAAAAGLSYFTINYWTGAYGWSVLFHHTFMGFLPAPAETPVTVSIGDYVRAVKSGLRSVFDNAVPLFAMLGVVAYGLRGGARSLRRGLLTVIAVTVGLRYLLFPILFDRMLAPYYVLVVALLIAAASREPAAVQNNDALLGARRAS